MRERLEQAEASLPDGFTLAIFDAWRSGATIRALYQHFYGPGSTLPPGFLANPDEPGVWPPHSTGGAVDLTLAWRGKPLALCTYFDDFSDAAASDSLKNDPQPADELARSLRRLLLATMTGAGLRRSGRRVVALLVRRSALGRAPRASGSNLRSDLAT